MNAIGCALAYSGSALAVGAFVAAVRTGRRIRGARGRRALVVAGTGVLVAFAGLLLPAPESRVARVRTRLDEFAPAWQFREFHVITVDAPPARVYEAMKHVRGDEIFLFSTLTWIRRAGRRGPASILNSGNRKPLIDVASGSGFLRLAEEAPREFLIGKVIAAPPGAAIPLAPDLFRHTLEPGFVLATMNFLISADGPGRSVVSTETRVFANSPESRRRFAAYWRLIYPGSAIIRRMWLRAIERRATLRPDP